MRGNVNCSKSNLEKLDIIEENCCHFWIQRCKNILNQLKNSQTSFKKQFFVALCYDISRDLNILLSLPDEVKTLVFRNNVKHF